MVSVRKIRASHGLMGLSVILFLSIYNSVQAQCPPNLDFEHGNFNNWVCNTGSVFGTAGINEAVWDGSNEAPGRHEIIHPGDNTMDEYGLFPKKCPNGSGYSVKLGNDQGGHEAEGVSYTYTIPPFVNDFAILYHYAVVLQDPGHLPYQQPRFRARVVDVGTGIEIDCVSFDFTASATLPGFEPSSVFGGVYYKDWTPVTVDLSAYAGRTVRLEFITSDCVFQEHFGYAYVDVNSGCNGTIAGSNHCVGDPFVNMTAPYGFQSYQWFTNTSFSTLMGSSQSMMLTPVPAYGSVFPVIVTPYPGFGCIDTLYATIGVANKPPSIAGPDLTPCSKDMVQLGTTPISTYSYTWTKNGDLLNNIGIANPFTLPNLLVPSEFIIKTTDLVSGCFAFDTVNIVPRVVDTSSSLEGKSAFCPGETFSATLQADNPATTIQWFQGNTPIPGATSHTFVPPSPGQYWAQIRQFGCTDSSRQHRLIFSPQPKAGFTTNRDIQCQNNPVSFTNTSTVRDGEPMTYIWRFSDGTTSNDINAEKAFTGTGQFTAQLVAISSSLCRDSVQKVITIMKDCNPIMPTAFTPNNDGLNDDLKPYLVGVKALKVFSIYNRFGNLVFTTNREGHGWNGKLQGVPLDSGVFVWMIEYVTADNQNIVLKGTVTLIR